MPFFMSIKDILDNLQIHLPRSDHELHGYMNNFFSEMNFRILNIAAAFQGMHVSPANHSDTE